MVASVSFFLLANKGIYNFSMNSKMNCNCSYIYSNFYEKLKGLFLKTVGALAEIKEALKGIEGIEKAFIYGTSMKGEEMS